MDIERAPQEELCLRMFSVLAIELPECRKTLGSLGMPGSEDSLGQIRSLPQRFHCLPLVVALEARSSELAITSCPARAVRPCLGMFGLENISDLLLHFQILSLL